MATNKQRDAERRRLQQQLAERRAKEQARRRFTLISSVVGSLAVIAVIVIVIVAATSGDDKTPAAKGPSSTTPTSSASTSPTAPSSPVKTPGHVAAGAAVTFEGVTVKGAKDLTGYPVVTSKSTTIPTKLEYKDVVVGKGKAATPKSTVSVQYTGVLYSNGTEFDSSWKRGQAADFSLQGVVKGFTDGIGGASGIPPMKIGGRRIMILPGALGYGANGNADAGIGPNAPLVFVVDLVKVS